MAGFAASGGEAGRHAVVIVNDRSEESRELGVYFAAQHGLLQRQICHLDTTTNPSIDWVSYTNEIAAPIQSFVQVQGLSNQVDLIVLSCGLPYRVYTNSFSLQRHAGITATLFYGLKTSPNAFVSGCDLAPGSTSPYFGSERAFHRQDPPSTNPLYLAAVCSGFTLDDAKRLVDRSAAEPSGTVSTALFLHTSDTARNVEWPRAEEAEFRLRFATGTVSLVRREADTATGESNLAGIVTGSPAASYAGANRHVAGSFSEHLTSYGGYLLEVPPEPAQMSALRWLQVGNSGSYGTVVEPCNYIEKFTEPAVYYYLARGFSIAESHFMSVRNPYQGVFVGDPLAAPYARRPEVSVSGLVAGATASSTVTIAVTASSAGSVAAARIDAWIDGLHAGMLTSAPPAAGNIVRLVTGAVTSSYVVASDDNLFDVTAGLTAAVNASGGPVRATNTGDRIQLVSTNDSASGAAVAYSAITLTGAAARLSLSARAATANLLDSEFHAREFVALQGVATTGDTVTCTLVLTNGIVVTSEVVAAAGESAVAVLQRVMNAVNADPQLQTTQGVAARYLNASIGADYCEAVLEARRAGPGGGRIAIDWLITPVSPGIGLSNNLTFSDRFNDNRDVMGSRGVVFLHEGLPVLSAVHALDTTALADGPHTVTYSARDGSSVQAEGSVTIPFSVDNLPLSASVSCSPRFVVSGGAFTVSVSSAGGAATQCVLIVEGKTFDAASGTAAVFVVTSTNLGAGSLDVQGLVRSVEGSAASELAQVAVYTDRDADGLSDQWEYVHFGSATNATGPGDPDADGANNRDEWLADTDPVDPASRFDWTQLTVPADLILRHVASVDRLYALEAASSPAAPWTLAGGPRTGGAGSLIWTNPPGAMGVFRVRATLP